MPLEDAGVRQAMALALHLLGRREHSAYELSVKLERRGIPGETVEKVIAECLRLGYLDERRAAAGLAESLKRRGFGSLRLRRELFRRRLIPSEEEHLPAGFQDPEEEAEAACRAAEKKWPTLGRTPSLSARKAKLERFLRSRGFSEPALREALKRVAAGETAEDQ